jgi:predicted TIM-barrel fold metal-dependent hydrolase
MISRRSLLTSAGAAVALAGFGARAAFAQGKKGPKGDPESGERTRGGAAGASLPIIDTHAHIQASGRSGADWDGGLRTALVNMDKLGIRRTLILPPPQPFGHDHPSDLEFAAAVKRNADRFGIVGGGGSLNPMINRRRADATMPDSVLREFDAAVARIVEAGAVAFGEMACEHFSVFVGHPYESTPPDHPLFLRLADVAADRDMPIDLHMEAVPTDMTMPPVFKQRSSANPDRVAANVERFERLLAHNRKARIIWVHLGWDIVGFRTLELTRALLSRHENLFLQLRPLPPPQPGAAAVPHYNLVLTEDQRPDPTWVALISEFPERFVIGSDTFYVAPGADPRVKFPPPLPFARPFVNGLPPQIAAKVAHENAARLYRLPAV